MFTMDSWAEEACKKSLGEKRFKQGLAAGWIRRIGEKVLPDGETVSLVSCHEPPSRAGRPGRSGNRGSRIIRGVSE